MAKKILILLSCVFCLQFVVAQTMSDEQIIDFVLAEQEKGADQRAIATKLLQKGVSPERIRDIKKKYDNEKMMSGKASLVDAKKRCKAMLCTFLRIYGPYMECMCCRCCLPFISFPSLLPFLKGPMRKGSR